MLKSDLNYKYLWEDELSERHLKRKQKARSLQSVTTIEENHWLQVDIATFICNLITNELKCIEDDTKEYLQFLPQAKKVARGFVWN